MSPDAATGARRDERAGWDLVPIGDLCSGIYDGPHATPTKTETGPIFLGISNLVSGRLDLNDVEHLSDDQFVSWTRRVVPQGDDVVFSYETRLGEAAILPSGLQCCLGRRLALMRPDRTRVVPRFLLYTYLGPEFQETLRAHTISGSTVDRIPLVGFPQFLVRVPPLDEQQRIVDVLAPLDDKIESNRRLAKALEDTGRALFETGLAKWKNAGVSAPLAQIAVSVRALAGSSGGDLPYIGLDEMPRGSTALFDWQTDDAPTGAASRFTRGDILFGKLRPYLRKVGVAPVDGRCSTEILVLRPKEDAYWGVVFGHVSSEAFIQHCNAISTGTKMPRAEWEIASQCEVAIPGSAASAQALTERLRELYGLIGGLARETRSIAEIRALLLSGLLLGSISVDASQHRERDSVEGAAA